MAVEYAAHKVRVNRPDDVRIRPYRVDDAATVLDAVRESVRELQPWMPWCHPGYSLEESRSWLETQVPAFEAGTAFEFAIASADGRYLGGIGLNQIDRLNQRANLGYWVRSAATRRGVATAAVRLVREWGFQHTGLIRLELVIAVGNLASLRVAEKSGAFRESTARSRLLLDGKAHDAVIYSFVRPDPARPRSVVMRVRELPSDIGPLVTESEGAGMQLVRRLADDWVSGRNRFDGPGEAFFTARIDGRLVGVCGLNVDPYASAPSVGRVRHLYVLSDYRRSGIGHRLMNEVIAAAKESFGTLRLRTSNPPAARLYEKLGFRRTDGVTDCSHLMNLNR